MNIGHTNKWTKTYCLIGYSHRILSQVTIQVNLLPRHELTNDERKFFRHMCMKEIWNQTTEDTYNGLFTHTGVGTDIDPDTETFPNGYIVL